MAKRARVKSEHARISMFKLTDLRPSPENDRLYKPVVATDPEIIALASSIRERGVIEPLVATLDGYLLSGHRRFAAAGLAGLTEVPCRVEPIRRSDNIDHFLVLLREYNRQRVKTRTERVREELVSLSPADAFRSLVAARADAAQVEVATLEVGDRRDRAEISAAKRPLLAAVKKVLEENRKFWPLSDRRIHYLLLNDPPLRHASKPNSRYRNDRASYNDLTDLLTRARLTWEIPFVAIADETRPVVIWDVFDEVGPYIRRERESFMGSYYRDLMQSQPNHIEVLAEKNTIAPILKPVCGRYTIPLTSGRGFCSLPPRYQMAERYEESGKDQLIILFVTDLDPEGEAICESFARSMRDDFDINDVVPIKVALTGEQVERFRLPPGMSAKKGSKHRKKFVAAHGEHVWELEALPAKTLQKLLRDAIESVIDREAFNAEAELEKKDALYLTGVKRTLDEVLSEVDLEEEGDSQ